MTATAPDRSSPPTSAELAERLETSRTALANAEGVLAVAQSNAVIDASPKTLEAEAAARAAYTTAKDATDRLEAALDYTSRREAKEARDARLYSLRIEDLAFTEALDRADKAATALDKALAAYASAVVGYVEAARCVAQRVAAIGGRARQDHSLPTLTRELPRQLARATNGAFALPGASALASHDVTSIAPLAADVLSHTVSWRGDIERAAAAMEGAGAPPADPGSTAPPIPSPAAHATGEPARAW
jgi:hypothetical protein